MDSSLLLVLLFFILMSTSSPNPYCTASPLRYLHDVDHERHFCPPELGEKLSFFCLQHADYSSVDNNNYGLHFLRRGIIDDCCNKACTLRYLTHNFCKKIRPELLHFFLQNATRPLNLSTTIEIKPLPETPKSAPNELATNAIVQARSDESSMENPTLPHDEQPDHRIKRMKNVRKRKAQKNSSLLFRPLNRPPRNRRNHKANKSTHHKVCRCTCKIRKKDVPKAVVVTDRPIQNYPVYHHASRDIDDLYY